MRRTPLSYRLYSTLGRLAARFADEYNMPFSSLDDTAAAFDRVRAACTAADRDPASMIYSAALVLCCGADEAEVERRAAAIGREPAELRANGAAGAPDEVVAKLEQYAALGATRVYLQVLDLDDLEHLGEAVARFVSHGTPPQLSSLMICPSRLKKLSSRETFGSTS